MKATSTPLTANDPSDGCLRAPPLLAVVIPCFNEEAALPATLVELLARLDEMIAGGLIQAGSFLYLVDDGSRDASWALIAAAHAGNPRIRGLRLTRNFGHQNALLAGLLKVREHCDASISIDADLQQDSRVMAEFVAAWRRGAEVVLGVRHNRNSDGWFKRSSAQLFYQLMNAMGVRVVAHHADYRLLGRRAMAALSEYGESNLFLRYICSQLGFRSEIIPFHVQPRRQGQSKYNLGRMLQLAMHGIAPSSVVPLRLVALTGLCVFLLSTVMAGYVLYQTLVVGSTVPGWASTTLPIYFIGGVQILCLGVIGEYVGQTLIEVKHRPRYHGDDELF